MLAGSFAMGRRERQQHLFFLSFSHGLMRRENAEEESPQEKVKPLLLLSSSPSPFVKAIAKRKEKRRGKPRDEEVFFSLPPPEKKKKKSTRAPTFLLNPFLFFSLVCLPFHCARVDGLCDGPGLISLSLPSTSAAHPSLPQRRRRERKREPPFSGG